MKLLIWSIVLFITLPCSAEEVENWRGYEVGDVYYNEYTRKPLGIVTGFETLRGEIVGIRYNPKLYEKRIAREAKIEATKEKQEVRGLRMRIIKALEQITERIRRKY